MFVIAPVLPLTTVPSNLATALPAPGRLYVDLLCSRCWLPAVMPLTFGVRWWLLLPLPHRRAVDNHPRPGACPLAIVTVTTLPLWTVLFVTPLPLVPYCVMPPFPCLPDGTLAVPAACPGGHYYAPYTLPLRFTCLPPAARMVFTPLLVLLLFLPDIACRTVMPCRLRCWGRAFADLPAVTLLLSGDCLLAPYLTLPYPLPHPTCCSTLLAPPLPCPRQVLVVDTVPLPPSLPLCLPGFLPFPLTDGRREPRPLPCSPMRYCHLPCCFLLRVLPLTPAAAVPAVTRIQRLAALTAFGVHLALLPLPDVAFAVYRLLPADLTCLPCRLCLTPSAFTGSLPLPRLGG